MPAQGPDFQVFEEAAKKPVPSKNYARQLPLRQAGIRPFLERLRPGAGALSSVG